MAKRVGRTFYRGTKIGSGLRISTGDSYWDSKVFVTDTIEGAKWYGPDIYTYVLKPDAKILIEGTRAFRSVAKGIPRNINLLQFSSAVVRRAEAQGWDAVYFERQTDVGTVIINIDAIESVTGPDGKPVRLPRDYAKKVLSALRGI
jgi:hypothetical protein